MTIETHLLAFRLLMLIFRFISKTEILNRHSNRRQTTDSKMRRWYWFLLILFLIGLAPVSIGEYYLTAGGNSDLGFELTLLGAFPLGVLGAIGCCIF
jgi:hypothetical protein